MPRLQRSHIKLNDYLLAQAANKMSQPSSIKHQPLRVPVHLQAVATLCNQLLRSGTSIGANNAEATSAISKADFKSKSYIALKEARDCEELVKVLTHRCKKIDENIGGAK